MLQIRVTKRQPNVRVSPTNLTEQSHRNLSIVAHNGGQVMKFKVLGPLTVLSDDGTRISLSSVSQRRLASMLALRAGSSNSVVSADWLCDQMELSAGALRTSITRLRRVVGEDVLTTIAPGYALQGVDVDSQEFERLLALHVEGSQTAGQAKELRSGCLMSALELWTGTAYAEFADESWAIGEVTRLEELRAGAVEDLAESLLANHQWSPCIAQLEALIEVHPFRDRPRRILMQALADSGRRTDALRAFQLYRRFLLDEVGVEPSATIIALDREIGQAEQVPAVPETSRPTAHDPQKQPPLPGRLSLKARTGFAGRVAHRQLLNRHFQESTNLPRVALLSGEPGIGKTRLATWAALAAYEAGATVLLGRCDEDISVSYQPWIEALSHLVLHAPQQVLVDVGDRQLADIAGLAPRLIERFAMLGDRVTTDSETDRHRLFSSVVSLFKHASAERPIVLLFDDVHWADKPSLLLLRHLLQSSSPMRLQVIVTFRDAYVEASSALADFLAAMHRENFAERLQIDGLLENEIVELIEEAAGQSLDIDGVALARILRRETDGNPFFVGEMLRHLVETGVTISRPSGRGSNVGSKVGANVGSNVGDLLEAGLPQSVREVVNQRVARLGLNSQHVLRLAAVIGREFDVDLLVAVARMTEGEVLDILERAQTASLVQEVGTDTSRYTFVHALIDQTLYESIGTARTRLAHRQIAECIELFAEQGTPVVVSELAHHWMNGGRASDSHKMVTYARAAGDVAVSALAPDEAARWYAEALEVLDREPTPDHQTRTELLVSLGSTQLQDGEHRLQEAAELALRHGNADGLADAVLADVRGWRPRLGLVDNDRIGLIEAALAGAGDHDSARRARLLKVYALELAHAADPLKCWALDEEAVNMARRVGDQKTLLHTLIRKHTGFWAPDSLSHRLETSREAVALAKQVGDPASTYWANSDLVEAAIGAGSRSDFDEAALAKAEAADQLGHQPGIDWLVSAFNAQHSLLRGRFDEAEHYAQCTFEQAALTAGGRNADVLLAVQLATIWFQTGDDHDIVSRLFETVERKQLDFLRALLVRALARNNRLEEATEIFAAEFRVSIPTVWNHYWLTTTCYWADAAVHLGHTEGAELLYERLLPWQSQIAVSTSVIESSVSLYLGMLATLLQQEDMANTHFAAALSTHETMSMPFAIARTKLEWGRCLLQGKSRDAGRAYDLLTEASIEAKEYGFVRIHREAIQLIGSRDRVAERV